MLAKDKPIKYFVQKGIVPPFKAWARIVVEPYRTLPDGKSELQINKTTMNYEGVFEAIFLILDHMNKQNEPYDGFAGFSQGMFLVQIFYKCVQYFGKSL